MGNVDAAGEPTDRETSRPFRRTYTRELRSEAVACALASTAPISVVAQELDVHPATLRRWVREHRADLSTDPTEGGPDADQADPTSAHAPTAMATMPPDELFPAVARLPVWSRLLGVLAAWGCALLLSLVATAAERVVGLAAAVHVLCLAVAFGAVIVVDWHGLLWLAGRRGLLESTRLAAASAPLIWCGLGGLMVSGAFLHPDLTRPLTWTKLLLVLLLGVNGAVTGHTARALRRLPPSVSHTEVPRRLKATVACAAGISQIGWWGTILIGFLTHARG
jgi:transposase-like protein